MENSSVKPARPERAKKIRSFDIKSVDKNEGIKNESKDRKRKGVVNDSGLENKKKRRKSSKEAFLSSFDLDEEVNGSGDASVTNSHLVGKLGVLLDNGVRVPKRPRDFVRRRKSEKSLVSSGTSGEQVSKTEGSSVGKSSSIDKTARSNGSVGKSNSIEKAARSNGGGKSKVISSKRNLKIGVDGGKKISSKKIYAQVPVAEEQVHFVVNNNGVGPSSKKKNSNCRKKKGNDGLLVKVEPRVDNSLMMDDSFDDDEDNLEENAAMMLSSRFAQFSPKSRSPSTNGVSSLVTYDDGFVSRGVSMSASSELSSGDVANRVLRPNKKHKRDGFSQKRRHFYEISSRDVDAFWLLNKRIKVYWPLDECWYYGSVCDYSPEIKQHHIKYDDRDEEWIDLQNEKIKLLLLPSEVPKEAEPGGDSFGNKNDDVDDKNLPSDDSLETSYLDSEPLSSWLVRSSRKVKSSHLGFSKNHKTSYLSSNKLSGKAATGTEHLKKDRSLKLGKNKLNCNLALPNSSIDCSREDNNIKRGGNSPVVYVRRRFKKKDNGSMEAYGKGCVSTPVPTRGNGTPLTESERLFWLVDNVGLLKLPNPFVDFKKIKIVPGLPVNNLIDTFGEDSWLVRALYLLKYGTITNTWPKIHLEILFVDSVLGLLFLSFQGSLKQAVESVILIMSVFCIPDGQEKSMDMPMPVTSIRFKLSCSEDSEKRHVFSLYSFFQVKCSKWMSLNSKMQRHCLLSKEIPLFECTYDSLKTKEADKEPPLSSKRQASSENEGLWKEYLHDVIPKDDLVNFSVGVLDRSPYNDNVKHERLLSLARLFSVAPSLSLHLQFIMETNVPCVSVDENNAEISSMEVESSIYSEPALVAETASECNGHDHHNGIVHSLEIECVDTQPKQLVTTPSQFSVPKDKDHGLSVEVLSVQPDEKPDMALNLNNKMLLSPEVTSPMWHSDKNSLDSSHVMPGRNPGFINNSFSTGPRKRRTQVQYTLPSSSNKSRSKPNSHNHRIRKAQNIYRNKGFLACDGNVLVTIGDKGWREYGARVELESADHDEWKLAVKFSGMTRYSYKPSQFFQPGSTNRYTLAMIWRGGKDWALEFPDRNQWVLFKEMYEECFNRNIRAASVKHIPIPGVRLIEEYNAKGNDLSFIRNSSSYIRQVDTDAEMAMDPSRVLYDMDSEDEMWVDCKDVSEEFFEKVMNMLEKVAFAQQRDDFCIDEIEECLADIGPMESIKTIYEHWRTKRQRKGMPLIRHLQAPLWESYQLRVKKWEQAVATTNTSLSRCNGETPSPEKPPMFAFCLKPRGLEIPNKGTKQRSHRRYPVSSNSNYSLLSDHDGPYTIGRRSNGYTYYGDEKVMYAGNTYDCSDTSPSFKPSTRVFSPRDGSGFGQLSSSNDSYEWNNHNPKLRRNMSKNVGFLRSTNNVDMMGPYNHSTVGRSSSPKWPNQRHNQSVVPSRYGFEQLDGSVYYEFQLRDAAGAAKHALNMARLKREKAKRLLYKADLATHKASVALMISEVIKASFEDLNGEDDDSDDDESTEYDSYGDGSDDDDSTDSESTR